MILNRKSLLKHGLAAGLLFSLGCSTNKAMMKQVEDQAQAETKVETPEQAAAAARVDIKKSTSLNDEQKVQFLSLIDRTAEKNTALRSEEAKLKASLFERLSEGKYDRMEIAAYRKKLKDNAKERTNLMFSNFNEARNILGVEAKSPELLNMYRYRVSW